MSKESMEIHPPQEEGEKPGYDNVLETLKEMSGEHYREGSTRFSAVIHVGPDKARQIDQTGDHITSHGSVRSMRANSTHSGEILNSALHKHEKATEHEEVFSFNDLDNKTRVDIPSAVMDELDNRLDSSKGTGFLNMSRPSDELNKALKLRLVEYKDVGNGKEDLTPSSLGWLAIDARRRLNSQRSE